MKNICTRIGLMVMLLTMFGVAMADTVLNADMSLRAKMHNAFKDITVEVSPSVEKMANFSDLKIDQRMTTFTLSGVISYPKSCKFLQVDVKFYDKGGVVVGTAPGIISDYVAQENSHFSAGLITAAAGAHGPLDIAKLSALKCVP